jgi:hypothetical protein
MSSAVTLVKVTDHEGHGVCGLCQREGLRWICTLSDGSTCGVECAKRVMGWKPAPKSYAWAADFTAVAEHREGTQVFVLWRHKTGTATRETLCGGLQQVGGVERSWTQRGWAF